MDEDLQDYLADWFSKHGNHDHFSSAEEWVNYMPNWELLQWIGFYINEYMTK